MLAVRVSRHCLSLDSFVTLGLRKTSLWLKFLYRVAVCYNKTNKMSEDYDFASADLERIHVACLPCD